MLKIYRKIKFDGVIYEPLDLLKKCDLENVNPHSSIITIPTNMTRQYQNKTIHLELYLVKKGEIVGRDGNDATWSLSPIPDAIKALIVLSAWDKVFKLVEDGVITIAYRQLAHQTA